MKKILLLTVLSLSFYGFSQNQELLSVSSTVETNEKGSTFQGVKYGVRAGYTISHLDFDGVPIMENKHRNSMYIGFFANIGMSRTLSIVPELQFSAEGAKAEVLNLDYIQMPVFFRFRFSEKFHAGLGPQIGLKVHKEDDGMKNLGYSGVAGVEYKINYALYAEARYIYGLSNVFDDGTGVTAKNRNIQLGIGYKF
ncbi:PorT family protein [Flavobacteriaceae bacterium GSB9]|nr:PorT family protein [Flavobacteriaceae bacterium GSB9]